MEAVPFREPGINGGGDLWHSRSEVYGEAETVHSEERGLWSSGGSALPEEQEFVVRRDHDSLENGSLGYAGILRLGQQKCGFSRNGDTAASVSERIP